MAQDKKTVIQTSEFLQNFIFIFWIVCFQIMLNLVSQAGKKRLT